MLTRLRPSLNQAMVVTMAVIWEEAIDGAAFAADVHAAAAHTVNSLLVTVLCVAFKCATQAYPKTALLDLVTLRGRPLLP